MEKKKCPKCNLPWVMGFDHKTGSLKIGSISYLAIHNTSNFEKIKEEIKRCDLVCANCHRQRTHDRFVKIAAIANVVKAPL